MQAISFICEILRFLMNLFDFIARARYETSLKEIYLCPNE